MTIYIPNIDKRGCKFYVSISYELYLVNGLKANMLVTNDVLCKKGFAINFSICSVLIHSCSIRIDVSARQHSEFFRQKILASSSTLMPP